MSAGIATLKTMEEEKLVERVVQLHQLILRHLDGIKQANPEKVKAIRGKGLLLGVELQQPVAEVVAHAREKGLLILQAGPNVIRLLPSFVTTEAEIEQAMEILSEAIADA
jgi:acetylornithine/N-succinyldiaminopimelate aminotransferase